MREDMPLVTATDADIRAANRSRDGIRGSSIYVVVTAPLSSVQHTTSSTLREIVVVAACSAGPQERHERRNINDN